MIARVYDTEPLIIMASVKPLHVIRCVFRLFYCTLYDVCVWVSKRLFVNWIVESQPKQLIYSVDLHFNNEHSKQARAPHINGPRDVPRCGALSLLRKTLTNSVQECNVTINGPLQLYKRRTCQNAHQLRARKVFPPARWNTDTDKGVLAIDRRVRERLRTPTDGACAAAARVRGRVQRRAAHPPRRSPSLPPPRRSRHFGRQTLSLPPRTTPT
jgi:hypothetical protein